MSKPMLMGNIVHEIIQKYSRLPLQPWTDEVLHEVLEKHAAELKVLDLNADDCIIEAKEFENAAQIWLKSLQEQYDVVGVEVEIYDPIRGLRGIVDILAKHKFTKRLLPIELKTGKWKSFDHQVQVQLYLMILSNSLKEGNKTCSPFGQLVYLKQSEKEIIPKIDESNSSLFNSILVIRNQLACYIFHREMMLDNIERCDGGRFGCICQNIEMSEDEPMMRALVEEEKCSSSISECDNCKMIEQVSSSSEENDDVFVQFELNARKLELQEEGKLQELPTGTRVIIKSINSEMVYIQGQIQGQIQALNLITIKLKPSIHELCIGQIYQIIPQVTYNNMKFAKRHLLMNTKNDNAIYMIQG
ncbi:MAG: hypothetical protein EOP45_06785 [Sphingobacteriaceae bacterium]|nr:MAG: hypothetical protein EOP45_06785 [Sphingobacteriaceae bacterium]